MSKANEDEYPSFSEEELLFEFTSNINGEAEPLLNMSAGGGCVKRKYE